MTLEEIDASVDFADIEGMTSYFQNLPIERLKTAYRAYKYKGDKSIALLLLVANWDRRKSFVDKKTARRKLADVVLSTLKPTGFVGPDLFLLSAIFDMIVLRKDYGEVLVLGFAVNTALIGMGEAAYLDLYGVISMVDKKMLEAFLALSGNDVAIDDRHVGEPVIRMVAYGVYKSLAFPAAEVEGPHYFDDCVTKLEGICKTHSYRASVVDPFVTALAFYITYHEDIKLNRLGDEDSDLRGKSALWRLVAADSRLKPIVDTGVRLGKAAIIEVEEYGPEDIRPLFKRYENLLTAHSEDGDLDYSDEELNELERLFELSRSKYSAQYSLAACSLQIAIISRWKLLGRDPSDLRTYENIAFAEVRRILDAEAASADGLDVLAESLWLFLTSEEITNSEAANYCEAAIVYLNILNWRDKALVFEYGSRTDLKSFSLRIREKSDERFYCVVNRLMGLQETKFPECLGALYLALAKRRNIAYSIEMSTLSATAIDSVLFTTISGYNLEMIQGSLPESAALLEFFGIPKAHAKSRGDDLSYLSVLVSKSEIRIFDLGSFGTLCQNEGGRCSGGGQSTLAPLEEMLAFCENDGCDRLFVCTEGLFNGMSFASMPYKNRHVIDEFAVCNIANASDLINPRQKHLLEKRALVLSDPDFGKGNEANFKELPGSSYEGLVVCQTIAEEFGSSSVTSLQNNRATKAALISSLQSSSHGIIHLSTHGEVEEGIPCLILAGINDGEDAKLFPFDLTRESLRHTDLAVFALCHAGKMSESFRESMSGFVKAALLSGASAAILPVDEIDDIASFVFFKVFYKEYLASPTRDIEFTLQTAITTMRSLSGDAFGDLFTENEIDMMEERFGALRDTPFDNVDYWGPWVCYTGRRHWY